MKKDTDWVQERALVWHSISRCRLCFPHVTTGHALGDIDLDGLDELVLSSSQNDYAALKVE